MKQDSDTGDIAKGVGHGYQDRQRQHVLEQAQHHLAVEASLQAYLQLTSGDKVKRRSLTLAVDKAQYEVERARRQYDMVDPANRLVAAELEKRWNDALAQQHQAACRSAP